MVTDALVVALIFMGLIARLLRPMCGPQPGWGYCGVITQLQDVPVALQVLFGGGGGGGLLTQTVVLPAQKFELEDVYVATRELIPLVESSSLPSRSQMTALLFETSGDVTGIRKSLQDLRSVILFHSEQ